MFTQFYLPGRSHQLVKFRFWLKYLLQNHELFAFSVCKNLRLASSAEHSSSRCCYLLRSHIIFPPKKPYKIYMHEQLHEDKIMDIDYWRLSDTIEDLLLGIYLHIKYLYLSKWSYSCEIEVEWGTIIQGHNPYSWSTKASMRKMKF